jgi:hypothetical protein
MSATQPSLFPDPDDEFPAPDFAAVEARTLARASDPASSHAAAAEVVASGAAAAQRARVLACLRSTPGLCSDEIAAASGLQRHAAARRCPELERLQLVRRGPMRPSRLTGRMCLSWWPVDADEKGAA